MRSFFVIFIEFIIILGVATLYFSYSLSNNILPYISINLILLCSALITYTFRQKNRAIKGNYITLTFLFLLSLLIVHFQYYLDYTLSFRTELDTKYYLDYAIVPKAITIAVVSCIFYLIGSTFSSFRFSPDSNNKIYQNRHFSLIFLKITLVSFFLLNIYSTPLDYYNGNYGEYLNLGKTSYLQLKSNHLLQISIWSYIVASVIIIASKESIVNISFIKYILKFGFIFVAVMTIYCILTLLSGSRGPVIKIGILLYVGYLVTQKKTVNVVALFVLMYIVGYSVEFIGYFRNVDGDLNFLTKFNLALELREALNESSNQNSIFPPSTELAGSIFAYHTVVMDQEHNEILYGLGALGSFVSIFPGLGTLISNAFNVDFIGSSQYITELLGTSYGTGTTALADIYLNFGFIGTIIIFTIFGYFLTNLDNKALTSFKNNDLIVQVAFMVLISNAIYLGRSSIFVAFGDIVLVYIFIMLSSLFRKN